MWKGSLPTVEVVNNPPALRKLNIVGNEHLYILPRSNSEVVGYEVEGLQDSVKTFCPMITTIYLVA